MSETRIVPQAPEDGCPQERECRLAQAIGIITIQAGFVVLHCSVFGFAGAGLHAISIGLGYGADVLAGCCAQPPNNSFKPST
jgi:hypothetical protein